MESNTVRVRALIIHNGHILLIRRVKKGKQFYTFPGGHLEEGETDLGGLVREAKEETNLDVSVVELFKESTNRKGDIVKLFKCKVLGVPEDTLPEVRMVGEEVERSSKANQYHLEWAPIDSFPKKGVILAQNISIMPDDVR
jgi:ADP-ribose pyrophosphatase YjhB (NUDIX family)